MKEIEKYRIIYSDNVKYDGYGCGSHGYGAYEFIKKMNPSSILDVGCGHNDFCKLFRKQKIKCMGLDFACPSADVICSCIQMPFYNKEFDLVTSFDALEHLLPEEINSALDEFARVSHRYIFSIAFRDSSYKVNGETLHPTVRPKEWWMDKIKQRGTVEEFGIYFYGKWINA